MHPSRSITPRTALRTSVLSAALLLLASCASPPRRSDVADSGGTVTVPMAMLGHAVLYTTVAGQPARLVLDPIEGMILDAKWAERHGVPTVDGIEAGFGRRAFIGGAGTERREARFARDVAIGVGTAPIAATRTVLPLDSLLAQAIGHEVDGLVGLSAFGDAIIHVSPEHRQFAVHARDGFRPPEGALSLAVRFDGGHRPLIELELETPDGVRRAVTAYFDFGMSGNLRITTRYAAENGLLAIWCQRFLPTAFDETEVGLGGALSSVRVRFPALRMGGALVDSAVVGTIAQETEGADAAPVWDALVGWGLLHRYDWWFDATGGRLWYRSAGPGLTPGSGEAGFSLQPVRDYTRDRLTLSAVDPDGAAGRSGLAVGDVIESLDGRRLAAGDAEWARSLLSRSASREVRLRVNRGGRRRDVSLTPRESLDRDAACATRDSTLVIPTATPGVELGATLAMPATRATAIAVLVSPAGPDDRDLSIGAHRIFRSLAESLSRAQVGTLRLDDRGVGASTGSWITTSFHDRAADLCAAVNALRRRHPDTPIGAIGLSEGGGLALRADRLCGPLAFIALLSTPLRDGATELRAGTARLLATAPAAPELRATLGRESSRLLDLLLQPDPERQRAAITDLLAGPAGPFLLPPYRFVPTDAADRAAFLLSPWYLSQVRYDVSTDLRDASAPLTGLYGTLDRTIDADSSAARLASRAGSASVLRLEAHNHLLQRARTGLPTEYAALPEPMSTEVTDGLIRAIREMTRRQATSAPR